jgi:NAD(P)-dependent dehydrogenase (short-subunit alcohol dehydrogenase family)
VTTAVVTGSASGIGAATRARLEAGGHRVVGVDLRDAEIVTDLSSVSGRAEAIRDILEACAGRIDRFVPCAGVNQSAPLATVASVNYFGTIELIDGLLDALRAGEAPSCVAICSNSARMAPYDETPYVQALLAEDEAGAHAALADGGHGFLAYAGSKLAVGKAIRRRAKAWGEAGVRLNAIAPGATRTPLLESTLADPQYGRFAKDLPVPLGRFAEPEEIAEVIEFLLGPAAAFVHGAIWYADGGTDASLRPDDF